MPYEPVEVNRVTPCFAPRVEAISIEAEYPGPIQRYKVQVYDFADILLFESETVAGVLPPRIDGCWSGTWVLNQRGGNTYVNPLLSPFRVAVSVEPVLTTSKVPAALLWCGRQVASVASSAVAAIQEFRGTAGPIRTLAWAKIQPRIGKDLTTVQYIDLGLRLVPWADVYREVTDGLDPANPPFNDVARKVYWTQYKLNETGYCAGPVTGNPAYPNRSGTQAYANAIRRYRMDRRIPSDGVTVPQNGPAVPGTLTARDVVNYINHTTQKTAGDYRNFWNGSDFKNAASDPETATGRDNLTVLQNHEADQLMYFLSMETTVAPVENDPGGGDGSNQFSTPANKLRYYIDCTRCANNDEDEWVEGNYHPGKSAAQTHKFQKEADWLSDPMLPVEATLSLRRTDGSSVYVQEAMGDVRLRWYWRDFDEAAEVAQGDTLIKAFTQSRPSRARRFVVAALRKPRQQNNFFNARQNVGGIIRDRDNDFYEVFRRFSDGAAQTDRVEPEAGHRRGVLDEHKLHRWPDRHASVVYFLPSLIAGDNYSVTAAIDFNHGFEFVNNDATRKEVLNGIHGPNLPGLQKTSARINAWRRLKFRMFVRWPDRTTWAGQPFSGVDDHGAPLPGSNIAAQWEAVREIYAAAFLYVPPFADIVKEDVQNLSPTIGQDYMQALRPFNKLWELLRPEIDLGACTYPAQLALAPQAELDAAVVQATTPSKPPLTVPDGPLKDFIQKIAGPWTRGEGVPGDEAKLKAAAKHYSDALKKCLEYPKISAQPPQPGNYLTKKRMFIQNAPATFENQAGSYVIKPYTPPDPVSPELQAELATVPVADINAAIAIAVGDGPAATPPTAVSPALANFIAAVNGWDPNPPAGAPPAANDPGFPVYLDRKILASARRYYLGFFSEVVNAGKTHYSQDKDINNLKGDQIFKKYIVDATANPLVIKLYSPNPDLAECFAFSPNRMSPGLLPNGIAMNRAREINAEFGGLMALPLARLLDRVIDRRLCENLVQGGRFHHGQGGIAIVDNFTVQPMTAADGNPYNPFGLSMMTAVDLCFTSFMTPYMYRGVLSHEIGHLLFLKHWQNAGGGSKIDHDQADCNCVMSYPLLPYGAAQALAPQGRAATAAELSYDDQNFWRTEKDETYANFKNGDNAELRLTKQHMLAQRYNPCFCGKCNLNLRGWNIYAHPHLPMASRPPNDGLDYLPAALPATQAARDALWPHDSE